MYSYLRQSTASQSRMVGPFVDDTDFKTLETGLTINNTDVKISKNGGAGANKNSGGGTHRNNGMYSLTFDATDTDTVGEFEVSISVSGALIVVAKFWVLEESIYDAIFNASAAGFDSNGRVDLGLWLGTAPVILDTQRVQTSVGEIQTDVITADAVAANSIDGSALATDAVNEIRNAITGGAYALDTDANGRVRIVDGTAAGELDTNLGLIAGIAGTKNTLDDLNDVSTAQVNTEVDTALTDIGLDHLLSTSVIGTDVADNSVIAYIVSKSATADWDSYDNTADALEAIRDRGDTAWITGGGGGITDILSVNALIPNSIDLADTATFRLGLMLTNALDDLPTTAEITPGTISIHRKAKGGTTWTAVVTDGACSEDAGLVYYDEVFDSGTGYSEGDSIRITFKSQKITVAANDYEIVDATGRFFYTEIRETATTAATIADTVWDEAQADHVAAGSFGEMATELASVLADTNELQTDDVPGLIAALNDPTAAAIADAVWDELQSAHVGAGTFGEIATEIANLPSQSDITGGAYALDTDANGRVRIVDGTGIGELDTDSGTVLLRAATEAQIDAIETDTNELQTDDIPGLIAALNDPTAAVIADTVWDELQSAHVTGGSFGEIASEIATLLSRIPDTVSLANLNSEVVDALNTDTYAEPSQGTPGATISLAAKLGYLYKAWRNKTDQDATTYQLYNDDASTVDHKRTIASAAGTVTIGEVATGP